MQLVLNIFPRFETCFIFQDRTENVFFHSPFYLFTPPPPKELTVSCPCPGHLITNFAVFRCTFTNHFNFVLYDLLKHLITKIIFQKLQTIFMCLKISVNKYCNVFFYTPTLGCQNFMYRSPMGVVHSSHASEHQTFT